MQTTLQLVSDRGPSAATISEINRATGAPTGSLYHRFDSRELLLSDIWLTVAESFQNGFLKELEGEDSFEAGLAAALFTPCWVREHIAEARIMLLYRREDFVSGDFPDKFKDRARELKAGLISGMNNYTRRRFGREYKSMMTRTTFALIHVPLGAVKPYVQMKKPVPGEIDTLISETYFTVLPKSGIDSP